MPNDVWRFLRDPNEQKRFANSLTDVANRGMVAGTFGAPVDLATQAANLLVAGGGYAGHKLGLLSQPPDLIDPASVPGSSEWIGNKMQRAGLLGSYRNPIAELGAGMLSPVAAKGAMKAGGLLAQADLAAADNAAKVSPMGPISRQRGALTFADGTHRDQRSATVKQLAEDAAAKLQDMGFTVDLQHSGSAMGPSSYIRVSDPQTGRFITDPLRISDHSKGPFNSQLVHDASGPEDIEAFIQAAQSMRAKGVSPQTQQMQAQQAALADKVRQSWLTVYERAKPKIQSGEALSNKERQAVEWVRKNGAE